MTEQIGEVTLDYTFYNGDDEYSDGKVERINIVTGTSRMICYSLLWKNQT